MKAIAMCHKLEENLPWKFALCLDENKTSLHDLTPFIFRSCWDYHLHLTHKRVSNKVESYGKAGYYAICVIRKKGGGRISLFGRAPWRVFPNSHPFL